MPKKIKKQWFANRIVSVNGKIITISLCGDAGSITIGDKIDEDDNTDGNDYTISKMTREHLKQLKMTINEVLNESR